MSDCTTPDPYETGSMEPGTMSFDGDGDGFAETTMVDFDGDGISDMFSTVDAAGGEHVTLDSDGDGMLDTVVSDFDGDGTYDLASTDTDGDGQLDTSFDPETGEPVDGSGDDDEPEPFIVEEEPVVDPELDDDGIHGDPMADVPYHQAQVGPNDCLPTSVAMVLTEVLGNEVPQGDVVDLANELGLLAETGMSAEGGVQLLEHYGVDAEVGSGTMDDLRASLDAGDQVIIGLDSDDLYGQGDAPFADDMVAGHAVVITGIDDEAGLVYINDPGFPDGAGVAISIEAFEDAWQDSDNTMILVEAETAGEGAESTEDAGVAGNASPFGGAEEEDGGVLESITRFLLMPFSLKV